MFTIFYKMIENDTVVKSFGNEWTKFDQSKLSNKELKRVFNDYFDIFPWKKINKSQMITAPEASN